MMLTCRSITLCKRIPDIARYADAQRNVITDITLGVDAAQTGARVRTLPVDASLVHGAVSVDITLRTAVGRRANHLWQT